MYLVVIEEKKTKNIFHLKIYFLIEKLIINKFISLKNKDFYLILNLKNLAFSSLI